MTAVDTRGDAQRIWFPEMIECLRSRWRSGLPFETIIQIRTEMDDMLQKIRSAGNLTSPVVKCPQCGRRVRAAAPRVSVRAMILSLNRFEIAPAQEIYALEKTWAAYRKQHNLDLYGKEVSAQPTNGCGHS